MSKLNTALKNTLNEQKFFEKVNKIIWLAYSVPKYLNNINIKTRFSFYQSLNQHKLDKLIFIKDDLYHNDAKIVFSTMIKSFLLSYELTLIHYREEKEFPYHIFSKMIEIIKKYGATNGLYNECHYLFHFGTNFSYYLFSKRSKYTNILTDYKVYASTYELINELSTLIDKKRIQSFYAVDQYLNSVLVILSQNSIQIPDYFR